MTDPRTFAEAVATVPYLPGLGPLHPDEDVAAVWVDLLEVNGTGRFLPYDKDRVWGGRKTDQILTDQIIESDTFLLVPVLRQRSQGSVNLYGYGDHDDALSLGVDAAAKLAAEYGAARASLLWFGNEPDDRAQHTVRIHLKTFDTADETTPIKRTVDALRGSPTESSEDFSQFAQTVGEGFSFLAERAADGIDDGPILTARDGSRIVGAIGPMRMLPDSMGRFRLLGQYFAVLPEHRGSGYGRDLWRAAMQWGHSNGAAYQLLQTELDGPSDRLCRSEGLDGLGLIHSLRVPV